MHLGVLGPLEVHAGDGAVPLGRPKQQSVLALLAVNAGQAVAIDDLVVELWPERPPASAVANARGYAGRLRRLFASIEPGFDRLIRHGSGYVLRLRPDELDLSAFAADVAEGRDALRRGEHKRAVARFGDALRLWRGAMIAGLPRGPVLAARCMPVEDERLAVTEELAEAYLALEQPDEAVALMREHARSHPVRERAHLLLMRGLYRLGDVAGALTAYAAVRTALVEELGIEPSPDLQELHRAILNRDPPRSTATVRPAAPPTQPVPAQLPPDVFAFTGRQRELGRLDALLTRTDGHHTAVVISAIAGTAGVGKTALAVHWGHRVRDAFPDGQLYVNLRGFDPTGTPVTPAEAIRSFLDALDVPPQRIPVGLEAQAALYRSLLADRRVLVLLDNARDPDQVRPLLPGTPGCLVLVTSRNQLTGLVAAEGAHAVQLDLLTAEESRELFLQRVGAQRTEAEPDAVDEIIVRCAGLPLALAIVAARAATQPRLSLGVLAADLRNASDRLDVLTTGDVTTDVRAVFSWSYQQLSASAARLFRLLGLHPGPDIGLYAAASLAGIPVAEARSRLTELGRAHLVAEQQPGRYTMHDLLHAYAEELAQSLDPADTRRSAVTRMLDHYLYAARDGVMQFSPARPPLPLPPCPPGVSVPDVADHGRALAWYADEHANMLKIIDRATADGFDTHVWQFAWAVQVYLNRQGHWHDGEAVQRAALAATRRLGDRFEEARVQHGLGRALGLLGRYDAAHSHFQQAIDTLTELGERGSLAQSHHTLAWLCERQGDDRSALAHSQKAFELFRELGHHRQGSALNQVGWYHSRLGEHEQALACCEEARRLLEHTGDRQGQAATWDSLGYTHHQLGNYEQAIDCLVRALELFRSLADRPNEADVLTHLGAVHESRGDRKAAADAWREALSILDELGHPDADDVRAKLSA